MRHRLRNVANVLLGIVWHRVLGDCPPRRRVIRPWAHGSRPIERGFEYEICPSGGRRGCSTFRASRFCRGRGTADLVQVRQADRQHRRGRRGYPGLDQIWSEQPARPDRGDGGPERLLLASAGWQRPGGGLSADRDRRRQGRDRQGRQHGQGRRRRGTGALGRRRQDARRHGRLWRPGARHVRRQWAARRRRSPPASR